MIDLVARKWLSWRFRIKWILIGILIALAFYGLKAQAYDRMPTGSSVEAPVTIDISTELGSGECAGYASWALFLYGTEAEEMLFRTTTGTSFEYECGEDTGFGPLECPFTVEETYVWCSNLAPGEFQTYPPPDLFNPSGENYTVSEAVEEPMTPTSTLLVVSDEAKALNGLVIVGAFMIFFMSWYMIVKTV